MILDTLDQAARYYNVNPLFSRAFAFIAQLKAGEPVDGKHTLAGEDLFCIVSSENPSDKKPVLESHRRYVDIQLPLTGSFKLGWSPLQGLSVQTPYDDSKDIVFFKEKFSEIFTVRSGQFCILFPEDAHAPHAPEVAMKKLVFKVRARI